MAERCVVCGSEDLRPARAGLRQCRDCTLAGAYPLPTPEELARLYDKDYYEAWGAEGGEDPAVKVMKQATFRHRLAGIGALPARAPVLDIGCATGFFLDVVAEAGGEGHGVEVSPYAAKVANARFPGRVKQGTLDDARYPDGTFFAVFMSDLIEHVPRPDALLAEAFRILAPGGHLVVCTPDFGGASARIMGKRWFHLKVEHIIYFTRTALARALADAGFDAVRMRSGRKAMTVHYLASQFRTYRLFPVTQVLNSLEKVLPRSLGRRPWWLPSGEVVAFARKPLATP